MCCSGQRNDDPYHQLQKNGKKELGQACLLDLSLIQVHHTIWVHRQDRYAFEFLRCTFHSQLAEGSERGAESSDGYAGEEGGEEEEGSEGEGGEHKSDGEDGIDSPGPEGSVEKKKHGGPRWPLLEVAISMAYRMRCVWLVSVSRQACCNSD